MSGILTKLFPILGGAPRNRRKRRSRRWWTRDRLLMLLELGLLLGSFALLAVGVQRRVLPLTLSMAAAVLAIMHVLMVRRSRTPSPAERFLEEAPMLDFSQAVRNARSVEGLYQSLIGM